MNDFDWDRHAQAHFPARERADYADGKRTPLWLKLLPVPFFVAFVGITWWSMVHTHVPGADGRILGSLGWFVLALAISVIGCVSHMRIHRPASYQRTRTVGNVVVAAYLADRAIHAAVRHYGDHED